MVTVEQFGAVGNDSTDCTSAFENAILAAGTGGTISIGAGTFRLSAITLTNLDGFIIEGSGEGVTILKTTTMESDFITINKGSAITIRNLDIVPSGHRTDGKYIMANNVSAKLWIENVRMISPYDGIYAIGCSVDIINLRVYSQNDTWSWHSAIYMQSCISCVLDRVSITMGTTRVILGGIVFESGCDTIYVLNSEVGQVGGTLGKKQGGVCYLFDHTTDKCTHPPNWIRLISCDAESLGKEGMLINSVNQLDILSPQIQTSQIGIKITGGNGISVGDGFISQCWEQGIWISGGSDISIRGTRVTGASHKTPEKYDQILVDGPDITNVCIDHCVIGDNDTVRDGLLAHFGINASHISDSTLGIFGPNTFGPNQKVNINKQVPYAVYLEQVYTEWPTVPKDGTWNKGDYVLTAADEDKASFVRCIVGGTPGRWMAGGIVGPKRIGSYHKTEADRLESDILDETIVDTSRGNDTILSAEFIPNKNLDSNQLNYAVLTISKRNSNNANPVIISQVTTRKFGPNSTGDWTAFKGVDFGAIPIHNARLGSNDVLTFKITKNGAGVKVPSGYLAITRRLG